MRVWWEKVPRDAKVAAAVAILVLLQTVALAVFGLAAARSQRSEAEQGLRTLSGLALARGLAEPVAESLSRIEAAVADAASRGSAGEACAVPLQPPVFTAGFALLPDGSAVLSDPFPITVNAPEPKPPPKKR